MDKAIGDLNEALRLNPQNVEGHQNRARLLAKKGEADGAIGDLSEALRISPTDAESYRLRGIVYTSKHDFDHAVTDFTALLKLNSTNTEAYVHRTDAYWLKGDFQSAIADCRTLFQLYPRSAAHCNKLAMMLATCPSVSARNGKEAVEVARRACRLSAWDEHCLATLAAAYAESGDFGQALKYQKQALAMANWPDPERKEMQKRLDLYEQGKPFHETAPQ